MLFETRKNYIHSGRSLLDLPALYKNDKMGLAIIWACHYVHTKFHPIFYESFPPYAEEIVVDCHFEL
jgi:hypothetical protein